MPPRRDPGFTFPPELTQLIQQQNTLMQLLVQNQNQGNNNNNPPPPPPPVDHLARFLRLNPPVFSSSTEPIVADDLLRKTARELTTAEEHIDAVTSPESELGEQQQQQPTTTC